MGFLSGRKEQKAAEESRRLEVAASRKLADSAKQEFKNAFPVWLDRLEDVRVELNDPPLSDETLAKAGEMPIPKTRALIQSQAIELNAYARSFADTLIEGRANDAETAGSRQFYRSAASFVRTVL
jgi:hypothetical protein